MAIGHKMTKCINRFICMYLNLSILFPISTAYFPEDDIVCFYLNRTKATTYLWSSSLNPPRRCRWEDRELEGRCRCPGTDLPHLAASYYHLPRCPGAQVLRPPPFSCHLTSPCPHLHLQIVSRLRTHLPADDIRHEELLLLQVTDDVCPAPITSRSPQVFE